MPQELDEQNCDICGVRLEHPSAIKMCGLCYYTFKDVFERAYREGYGSGCVEHDSGINVHLGCPWCSGFRHGRLRGLQFDTPAIKFFDPESDIPKIKK